MLVLFQKLEPIGLNFSIYTFTCLCLLDVRLYSFPKLCDKCSCLIFIWNRKIELMLL